jgi:predicted PurR-regulated permease PerM
MDDFPENSGYQINHRSSLKIFALRSLVFASICAGIIICVSLLWYVFWAFMLVFAGILLAIFLEALSRRLSGVTRIPYGWALGAVIVGLVGLGVLSGWLIGNTLAEQIGQLIKAVPDSLSELQSRLEDTSWGSWIVENTPKAGQAVSGRDVVSGVSGAASSVFQSLLGIVIMLFIGLYGASQPDLYVRGFMHLVPPNKQARAKEILENLGNVLRWWLLGQIFSMIVIGILTGLGLWLLGSKLPFALAMLAFVMEIIPNIGPMVAAAPAILLAFVHGPEQALYILLLYIVIQNVEGYLVIPLVQYHTVQLPPAVQIIAVLLLGMIGGFLGALIATPLAICIIILIQMLYVDNLNKVDLSPNA